MTTCDDCFATKHYRCRGCGCNVCADRVKAATRVTRADLAAAEAAKKAREKTARAKLAANKKKPAAPKVRPSTSVGAVSGATPWALTTQERASVYALHLQGHNTAEITAITGFTRSRVRSELARIRRGVLPIDVPAEA